ncbi:fungal-specific transcription factor domain-containing protein [Ilyonectria destructans]|nr:fungal-specific transcription factor domain-containing protein [Ilyonectria destructans]
MSLAQENLEWQPKKHSRLGCNTCKARKVKCDEGQPVCDNCESLYLECAYPSAGQRRVAVRRRNPRSCSGCRIARCKYSRRVTTNIDEEACLTPALEPAIMQLHWLSSPDLPDGKYTRLLVDSYFQNIHPLRYFSFIHKPSFLQKLAGIGSDIRSDALLYIIYILGAQFFALEYSDTAATAERLILGNTNQISIDSLITTQLLHDYALRMGNFTQAFVLSALMARMMQALQINLEYLSNLFNESATASLSVTARKCRRRLMWSCYITDVLCSNGVEQLMLIFKKDIKIQLPYNNRNFLHRQPSITRTLTGLPLDFTPPDKIPADLNSNMGILDSEFAQLDRELQAWYATLPANLQYTASTIYLRKESSQLGALCFFHCTYHQTILDFYCIGTPELFKLRSAFHFPPEISDFQRHLQYALFKKARTLGAIIAEAEQHSPRIIGDPWFPTIAYESNRVILFYLTQVTDPIAVNKQDLVLSSIAYLQSNLKALAEGLSRGAESILQKLGVDPNHILPLPNIILDDPYLAFPNRDTEAPQRAADSDLHPLSIFRMARKEIPEGHVPVEPSTANPSSTSGVLQVIKDLILGAAGMEGLSQKLNMFFTPDLARDWDLTEMILGSGTDDGPILWNSMTQMGSL